MNVDLLSRVPVRRARYQRRDRSSPTRLAVHQARSLAEPRHWAYTRSRFYSRHHAGPFDAPLSELPPVTKEELMGHFDEVVTDPALHLGDIEDHLRALVDCGADPGRPWRGRWWAAATAGTTGRRGVFVGDNREWSTVLASYARANDWAGVSAGLTDPLRVAGVSSRNPLHQSAVVGASLASQLVPTLRLDATAPIGETISTLNVFGPRVLVGYTSAFRPLMGEQLTGRLRIAPEAVFSASKVPAAVARREITQVWRSAPFDVYAATETAGISSPGALGNRHTYDDLIILEPVDHLDAPVPVGTTGARLWVTVLCCRTLPLIRYELSDQVTLAGRGRPCGRPFGLMAGVERRSEDVLSFPSQEGLVRVHPNVFYAVPDELTVARWQVVQEADALCILLVTSGTPINEVSVRRSIEDAMRTSGIPQIHVGVEMVDSIPRTALGKTPLVRRVPH